jgi:hypothetical protein
VSRYFSKLRGIDPVLTDACADDVNLVVLDLVEVKVEAEETHAILEGLEEGFDENRVGGASLWRPRLASRDFKVCSGVLDAYRASEDLVGVESCLGSNTSEPGESCQPFMFPRGSYMDV